MSGSRPTLGAPAPNADNDDVGVDVGSVVDLSHQLYEINYSTIPSDTIAMLSCAGFTHLY